jgi:hypothetical protein
MAEAQQLARLAQLGIATIAGRIDNVTTRERGGYFVRLVIAAKDEYSSPATVELESEQRLGKPGDDWKGRVEISGFRNDYQGKSGPVKSARNVLRVVAE